jgi:alpha-tubulin suppressor-like RCC1 family protein
MASNYLTDDPIFGSIDLDDKYITDQGLIDQFVGNGLWAWGNNNSGQLGLGNTAPRSSPVQVGSLTNWKQVSGGQYSTAAIKTDGTLWTWGNNNNGGGLGTNNTTSYSSPVQVGSLTNWKQVSVGSDGITTSGHTAAIKTDGTLWSWGVNSSGQLGTNDIVHRSSPVQVGSLTNWKQVSAGSYFTTAIKTDGTLWSWGLNSSGQLGTNNTTSYSSPVQVGSLTNWKQVSAGTDGNIISPSGHTAAIKTDGTLWSWGLNSSGQLGTNDVVNRSSPVQVGSLTNWKLVSAGSYFTTAIKTDGTLWSWGNNSNGQLGTNDVVHRSSPVQVGSLTNWKLVSGGNDSTSAIKTDGTLWSWGYNNYGQLGTNNNTSYYSPVQVGSLTNWKLVSSGFYSTAAIPFADIT